LLPPLRPCCRRARGPVAGARPRPQAASRSPARPAGTAHGARTLRTRIGSLAAPHRPVSWRLRSGSPRPPPRNPTWERGEWGAAAWPSPSMTSMPAEGPREEPPERPATPAPRPTGSSVPLPPAVSSALRLRRLGRWLPLSCGPPRPGSVLARGSSPDDSPQPAAPPPRAAPTLPARCRRCPYRHRARRRGWSRTRGRRARPAPRRWCSACPARASLRSCCWAATAAATPAPPATAAAPPPARWPAPGALAATRPRPRGSAGHCARRARGPP
jgi:hypothetical protein